MMDTRVHRNRGPFSPRTALQARPGYSTPSGLIPGAGNHVSEDAQPQCLRGRRGEHDSPFRLRPPPITSRRTPRNISGTAKRHGSPRKCRATQLSPGAHLPMITSESFRMAPSATRRTPWLTLRRRTSRPAAISTTSTSDFSATWRRRKDRNGHKASWQRASRRPSHLHRRFRAEQRRLANCKFGRPVSTAQKIRPEIVTI
jgi:hypothetical protein